MKELWADLQKKHQDGTATKKEEKLRRQMGKAMVLLSGNPRHPGLHSHDISSLTARYGQKVWESYLENDTPKAGRIFWCYGEALDETNLMTFFVRELSNFHCPPPFLLRIYKSKEQ